MNSRLFIKLPIMFLILAIGLFGGNDIHEVEAFSEQILQRGATGDDVIELQSRLQYNGYYHGTIDGVYGWTTYWAVRNFQEAFGLTDVDGLVGQKTKEMLKRATKYNREFVYANLNKGNRFTHYGGVPWDIQTAPNQQTIEKAKKTAEARRTDSEQRYKAQSGTTPNSKGEQPQGGGQAQGGEQPQGGGQAQGSGEQPQGGGQAQGGEQPQGGGQAQGGGEQPQGGGQAQGSGEQPQGGGQAQGSGEEPPAPTPAPNGGAETKGETAKEAPPEESAGPTAVNVPGGFSQNDIQLMANAVYGEARGEPYIGQVAVAAVIINRLNSATFPNTISGIIFEPLAFTAVADGQIWLTPNDQAKKAVLDAINGMDPTGGATYYFNPETATSKWIWGRPQIKRIGKHIFCK